jgi:hypothetical protein
VLPLLIDAAPCGWQVLPPGIHSASVAEIRAVFVDGIQSSVRDERFECWQAWRAAVGAIINVEREFVDGSFVTSRANPNDLDLAVWVDAEEYFSLSAGKRKAMLRLTGEETWDSMRIDAYIVPVCNEDSQYYEKYSRTRRQAEEAFETARDEKCNLIPRDILTKGYVEVVDDE